MPTIEKPATNKHDVQVERIRSRTRIVVATITAIVSLNASIIGFIVWRAKEAAPCLIRGGLLLVAFLCRSLRRRSGASGEADPQGGAHGCAQ